jgi:D-methionine transport system ATP-binding protein
MIEIAHLSHSHPTPQGAFYALKEVNLSFKKGESVGIIGASGAGKSTLLRTMNALIKPTQGQVLVDGVNLATLSTKELSTVRHRMAMVFQHFNLLAMKTVYHNVLIALKIAHYPQAQRHERVLEVLDWVGLAHKARSYPAQLSGGEKQRVGIARALATHPIYLLCDEITSALDPMAAKEIVLLLKNIQAKTPLTIIFISHQIEMVRQLCDRMIVMEAGQVVEDGSTLDLFTHPQHPATEAIVNSVSYDIDLNHDHVYELIYPGAMVHEKHLMSAMIKNFDMDVNVLHARMMVVGSQSIGYLYLQLTGAKRDEALAFLQTEGVRMRALPAGLNPKENAHVEC